MAFRPLPSAFVAGLVGVLLAASGCGDSGSDSGSGAAAAGSGGGDGGSSGGEGGGASSDGGGGSGPRPTGSGGGATGVTSGGGASTTATSTAAGTTVASSSTGSGADPHAAARQTCIDKINELRATKDAPPYARWTEGELCADEEATSDEQSGTPHGAFGMCGESGQNECLGHGPEGISACLDQMWAEKDLPGCAGCDACALGEECTNCDFFGSETGDVCGHYVNMRALNFSQAACGFSSVGGWDVINFR